MQSFKIMDYSLLVGIHNLDQACREQVNREPAVAGAADQRRPQGQKSLYSTAIEAIEAEPVMGSMDTEDKWVTVYLGKPDGTLVPSVFEWLIKTFVFFERTGGIPAQNSKGERLLVYIGIIDILQSYR